MRDDSQHPNEARGSQRSYVGDESLNAGLHDGMFDAFGLSSGVYYYRLTPGIFLQTKKLLLLAESVSYSLNQCPASDVRAFLWRLLRSLYAPDSTAMKGTVNPFGYDESEFNS